MFPNNEEGGKGSGKGPLFFPIYLKGSPFALVLALCRDNDDDGPQTTLSLIVGGRYARAAEAGEKEKGSPIIWILLKNPDPVDAIRTRRKSVENSLALEFETARFSEAPAVFWWCFWMSSFDQIPIFSRIRNLLNSRLATV